MAGGEEIWERKNKKTTIFAVYCGFRASPIELNENNPSKN